MPLKCLSVLEFNRDGNVLVCDIFWFVIGGCSGFHELCQLLASPSDAHGAALNDARIRRTMNTSSSQFPPQK